MVCSQLCVIILIIVFYIREFESVESIQNGTQNTFPSENITDFCQFLEVDHHGEEGDQWLEDEDFAGSIKLRGLYVVFRHGDRSPRVNITGGETGCRPSREVDRKNFEKYKELALSEEFLDFMTVDSGFSDYPRIPDDSKCENGLLTAEGALQLVKLGKFFRKQYSKSKLFTEESQTIKTKMQSSTFYRTLQSGLAFSSEFLFKQRLSLSPVQIISSNDTYLCIDEFCNCSVALEMRHVYEKEQLDYFKKFLKKNKKLAEKTSRIQKIEGFAESSDPNQIIDLSLGKYVCRRKPLPSNDGNCVETQYLNKLIEINTSRGQKMFNSGSGIAKKLQFVEAWPILSYVKKGISKIRQFSENNYIRIFSGHDSTLSPLLRVLGIPFVEFPHYASRLVFEIYEHSEEGLFIRVLYNGVNKTSDITFCSGDDLKFEMCRASAFEKFLIENDYFSEVDTDSFKNACKL